jgi:hypothetical protein
MKSKLLIVTFIVVLVCSAFCVALTSALCPTCNGRGEIPCPLCGGTGKLPLDEGGACEYCSGYGTLTPTISVGSVTTQPSNGEIPVQVRLVNEETHAAFGKVTAEVQADGVTYSATSPRTNFPPQESIAVTVTITGISASDYDKLVETVIIGGGDPPSTAEKLRVTPKISLSEVEDIDCPYCGGTGLGSLEVDCTRCGGTGWIDCPTCSSTTAGQEEELDISGTTYGVAAVAIVAGVAIAAFVVLKKRTVKEEDLKKLSPTDFQNWVLKRLNGKAASTSDARIGIDGYMLDGQPVSIKQADNVGRNVIENFVAAMGRHKSMSGTLVAFSFDNDAIRGRVRAKLNYGVDMQMVTVRELIEGRTMTV